MRSIGMIIGFLLLTGASAPKAFIAWDPARPLQWSDFKATPAAGSREAALTASSIEFSYGTDGRSQVYWTVRSKFFPELSWGREGHRKPSVLEHERLHFDITELYARILRKRFRESLQTPADLQKAKAIGKAVLADWAAEQDRYDRETDHSLDQARQQEWNSDIAQRLLALSAYAEGSSTGQK